jgi:2-oxo-3-hexenedioate decarboxylase
VSARVEALAEGLDVAAVSRRAIPQLSAGGELALDDAYAVQQALIGLRLARGERRIGVKLGFTSLAKMQQMGVHELICGQLTDAMLVPERGQVALERFIHSRAEPEIAFRLGCELAGEITWDEARAAIRSVAPALEIIDSRYAGFRFNLADVVADNCSSGALVVGAWRPMPPDIGDLPVALEIDGHAVQTGSTSAILGHPLRALVEAARLVARLGYRLEPGWIVMAGAATAAEPLHSGMHVRATIEGLGAAQFSCAGGAS